MSTVIKDLGAVSAYAYAVEKGYTGTEAEFAELMADYANVGQRAEDAAESALNSKTAAQTAATTATNKASEATTAAQTATTKAGEAQTSAQTASTKASEASASASTATAKATEATTAATSANTAKTDAVAAKIAAETAQGKAEDAQAAAESVAESIPSDYSQLSEDVTDLKEGLNYTTSYEQVTYSESGKAIKTNTDPIVLEMVDVSGFRCALVPCNSGDTFTVSGNDGSAVHLAVFTDASGNILTDVYTGAHGAIELFLVAPPNTKYLVLNASSTSSIHALCIKNYPIAINNELSEVDFELGGISGTNGSNLSSSARLRSKSYLDSNIEGIYSNSSGRFAVFSYLSDDTYNGIWNGTAFVSSGNPIWIERFLFSQANVNANFPNLKLRIVFEHPSIPENIKVYSKEGNLYSVTQKINQKIDDVKKNIPVIPDLSAYKFISDNYYMSDDSVSIAGSSTALYALYDALVTAYPSIVTKNALTSGSLTNYEYVFTFGNYNVSGQRDRDSEIVKPTILITAGVHGDEKSAVMSTYALLKAMCEGNHPATSILAGCKIRVIPCVTAWGFDNNKRWNSNGVNINRNFDAGWTEQGEAFTNNYSGASAASEDETKIVQNWLTTYKDDAVIHFDIHNSGFTSEVSYFSLKNTASNASAIKDEYRRKINDIAGYWISQRDMSPTSLIFGYTGYSYTGGSCDAYGTNIGIRSSLIETSWNQNSTGIHSNVSIGVGAESLSCIFLAAIEKMS